MKKQKEIKYVFNDDGTIGNEKITDVNVAEADLDYIKLFGANKNLYRTIPSLQDGLKPSSRRLFYTWWLHEKKPQNTNTATLNRLKFYKVNEISAWVVLFHPHSTDSIDQIVTKNAAPWLVNVQTIVPSGSFGNLRGDQAAAGRYRTAKMSEFMIDCFFDEFDTYAVPMKLGYNGEDYEPEYLPAKYPYLLFNPQFSGIGYGLSANIPSFNVSEVLDATIKLMKNPESDIMLIPDIPTGCDVIDKGEFAKINKTGKGKVTLRASSEIDFANNIIHISSLPLNSSSNGVINAVIDFGIHKGETFEDIAEIKDYTKEGEVSIDFYLKPDAKPEKVLEKLYKKNTGLKSTFPIGITVIDDYQDYELGIKDFLLEWIDYRIDTVRSMLLNKYQKTLSKIHMNDVLLMVFNKDNIDTTIKIAKNSRSKSDTVDKLMKTFSITSLQAGVIADMHVYNFNKDQYKKYKEDRKNLDKEAKEILDILTDESLLKDFIIKQLEEGKKKYGRKRLSKIVKENDKSLSNIPDTEHLIGVSASGYIKKLSLADNNSIGVVGKSGGNLTVLQVNNRENILVIDSKGYVTKVSVSAIPNMEMDDIGIELSKFFNVHGTIKAVMELPSMKILKVKNTNFGILFVTEKGLGKKVPINDFKKLTDTKKAITLNRGDSVADAMFVFDNTVKDVVISTDKGKGIRLHIGDIKVLSASAKGQRVINLADDDKVVSMSKLETKKKLLLYVTSSGRFKLTELKYYPVMKIKDDPLSLITLQGNEELIGVSAVDKKDLVMVYKKKSEPEKISISNIPILMRGDKGKKLIKTPKGDKVVAYKVFKK